MPSGPSHSHGSFGGGSHSFGGSRSGGFSSHRSSGGSRNSFSGRPFSFFPPIIHIGPRNIIVPSAISTAIVLFIIFAMLPVLLFIATVFTLSSSRSYINTMKDDAVYYANLIQTGIRCEATILDYDCDIYYNDYEYYYLTYSYKNAEGNTMEAETYTQYTYAQVQAKGGIGGKINIAYDADGFSINTDYSLENNFQYKYEKKLLSSNTTICIVSVVVFVVLCAGCITFIVYKIKKANKQETAKIEAEKPIYCPYCGYKATKEDKKCENCGANLK